MTLYPYADLAAITAEIEAEIVAIRRTHDVEEQRARIHTIGIIAGAYFAHQMNERTVADEARTEEPKL